MLDYLTRLCQDNPEIVSLFVAPRVRDEAGVDVVEGREIIVWDETYCEGLRVDGSIVVRFIA